MQKRVLLAALAAAALVVAPVAGAGAKQDGDGGSKKCEKTKSVGFKVSGTFAEFDGTGLTGDLTVAVEHANRHASDWLGGLTSATFELDGTEKVKFIGLTGFADAVTTDRVKLKAKLEQLKHGCPPEEDAVLEEGEGDTELDQVSTEPDVKKVKVKRPATETDENETDQTD
jgi:hypothetical protein